MNNSNKLNIKEKNDTINNIKPNKDSISSLNEVIASQKAEINNLKENVNDSKKIIDQQKNEIMNLKKKIEEINNNSSLSENFNRNELMCINFTSMDQKINYAIPCVGNDIFATIEEKLYQEYPEYRKTNNTFLANGVEILRFQTISENKIGNGKPVLLIVPS